MRLSEAIRAGARLRPQAFGGLLRTTQRRVGCVVRGSCALGAAAEVAGMLRVLSVREWDEPQGAVSICGDIDGYFPLLRQPVATLPCGCTGARHRALELGDVIIHLNDDHRWKRERIAAWVASLERK